MSRSRRARHLLLALAVTCIPSIAAADSDGYFCAAPGLIAFDGFVTGEPGRLIKIVRFGAVGGIQAEEQVRISDDIQTHDIVCRPGVIEVYSFDHVYVIDTSIPLAPKVREKRPSVHGRTGHGQPNLGHFARRAEVIVLQPSSEIDQFELVIARGSFSVKGRG
jgi:hypothetical protein